MSYWTLKIETDVTSPSIRNQEALNKPLKWYGHAERMQNQLQKNVTDHHGEAEQKAWVYLENTQQAH